MFLRSVLLRVLLSLSLILNGMSAAFATHSPAGHAGMSMSDAPVAAQVAVESIPPCHQAPSTSPAESDDAPRVHEAARDHGKTPDCCKSGTCRCDCLHAAQAGPAPWTEGALAFDHTRSFRRLTSAHATPALPHLIRPPIG